MTPFDGRSGTEEKENEQGDGLAPVPAVADQYSIQSPMGRRREGREDYGGKGRNWELKRSDSRQRLLQLAVQTLVHADVECVLHEVDGHLEGLHAQRWTPLGDERQTVQLAQT